VSVGRLAGNVFDQIIKAPRIDTFAFVRTSSLYHVKTSL
jgi:hypothetical protein